MRFSKWFLTFLILSAFSFVFSRVPSALAQDEKHLKILNLYRDHQHCVTGGGAKINIKGLGTFFIGNTGRVLTCDHIAKNSNPALNQEAPVVVQKQDDESSDGKKINEYYQSCVVDIETQVKIESLGDGAMYGSGFLIDKNGGVGTCAHVCKIKDDKLVFESFLGTMTFKVLSYEYWVVLSSKNRKYKAELVGANVYSDTAFMTALDADPTDYNVAKIGDPRKLRIDDRVYAIGSPFGLSGTFTSGKVSGLNRYVDLEYLEDYIQSDISINSGNSGGPLINADGEVVGINVRGAMQGGNLVLSVPMTLFKLDQLKAGEVSLPWFGMEAMVKNFPRMGTKEKPRFQDLAELFQKTGMDDPESLVLLAELTDPNNPNTEGWAVVTAVEEMRSDGRLSPAKIGGLKRGDLVKKINGKKVKNGMDIRLTVLEIPVGKEFEIELIRIEKGGVPKNMTAKVALEKKPEETK